MHSWQIYVGVGVGLSSVVACGASQEEIASQEKAAAKVKAAVDAEAAAAKLKSDAEAAAAKLKSDAEAAKVKLISKAETAAESLRSEASRLEAELPTMRTAVEEAQKKADDAAPALAKLQEQLDACESQREATRVKLHALFKACAAKAHDDESECNYKCDDAKTRCETLNVRRPIARTECWFTRDLCQNACEERFGSPAGGEPPSPCLSLGNQHDSWLPSKERDPCKTLNKKVNDAAFDSSSATRLKNAEAEVASKRSQADELVVTTKQQADKLVAYVLAHPINPAHPLDIARCGVSAFVSVSKGSKSFCMDRTEVTVAEYARCVASGKCEEAGEGDNCNAGVAGRENHPINCVSWYNAEHYCEAQGQRLPTEEEWKYAATGGDGRTYPWGNDEPRNQLCSGRGNKSTCAVGSYPKGDSPFGISDMSGNVWEWIWTPSTDEYGRNYGGSYDYHPSHVSAISSQRTFHSARVGNLGFRCAGSAALP